MDWVERPTYHMDLGRDPSERFKVFPKQAVENCKKLLDALRKMCPEGLEHLADAVRLRTFNRFQAEAEALAELVGATWREIMLATISYDAAAYRPACSTAVLPTSNGPVVARNLDWTPEDLLAQASYDIRFDRDGKFVFGNAGWPASIGMTTGISANGFCLILNYVGLPEGASINYLGYPVLLFVRTVVEDAKNFDDALEMLQSQGLISGGLFTLVGSENGQRVVVERSPSKHELRRGEPGKVLATTNHYRKMKGGAKKLGGALPHGFCSRHQALHDILDKHCSGEGPDDETLLKALADARVIQPITAQHVILRPRSQEMRLFVPKHLLDQT